MMTTTEILREIRRLPRREQLVLRDTLTHESEANGTLEHRIGQNEFDRNLLEDSFLVSLPSESGEEDDYVPVEISGPPLSETIIEERR